uniref:Sulfhydryl oxidase n=1 Tax=Ailuropoda melanoleuca TaxID=9646 RepID=A0A7N5JHL1_AILME
MPRRLARVRQRHLMPPACVFLVAALLLPVPVLEAQSLGLYSPEDPLVLLQADTLEQNILNSTSAWVVEFYASWCGHCKNFAPTWKALANDVKDWRPAVNLAVIDCADMTNQKVCSKFGIAGYPTVKFFKAFATSPQDGVRIHNNGDDIQTLRETIITSVERHEVLPSPCPPLQPISVTELRNFFQANNVTYLALIFEKDDSFLGREVALDMVQFKNIAVRRVLQSNKELVNQFNITAFPSGLLVVKNGSYSSIPGCTECRPLYTEFLRNIPGVFRRDAFIPTVPPSAQPPTTSVPWKVADKRKLYMADLESAVLYTLRVEAALFPFLDGERLSALKQYVSVLVKYFPGRFVVMNYLRDLDWWLRPKTNVSQTEWEEALRNKKEFPNSRLPEHPIWVGCQGSKPQFRGFPCGLWTLFHLLTVQEAARNPFSPSDALPTMRKYIRHFFGCRMCAEHFENMAAESMHEVRNREEAVLWLWSRHNRVNARLAGTASDDPKFPKVQWPPRELCQSCQFTLNGRPMWNTRAIQTFFKNHFSLRNIYLDFIKFERGHSARRDRGRSADCGGFLT